VHESPPEQTEQGESGNFGCHGAAIGGCLLPFILFFVAAALGDTGGPLFWPILATVLAPIGLGIGLCIRRKTKSSVSIEGLDHDADR
jgi:hypothetical protein